MTSYDKDPEKVELEEKSDLDLLPKDHGWSWICLIAAFTIQVITIGIGLRTYGVIYEEIQSKFGVSSSAASWIPAIYCSMLFFNGVPSNALARRFGTRPIVLIGGLLHSSGMLLSIFAWRVECLYFTYGFLGGIGTSLALSPSVVAVSQHFRRKQALAIGLAFSGNGVGAMTFAPLVRHWTDVYGLTGSLLLLSAVSLHVCACGLLLRPPSFYRRRQICKNTPMVVAGKGVGLKLEAEMKKQAEFEKSAEISTAPDVVPRHTVVIVDTNNNNNNLNNVKHSSGKSKPKTQRTSRENIGSSVKLSSLSIASILSMHSATTTASNLQRNSLGGVKKAGKNVTSRVIGDQWQALRNPLLILYALCLGVADSSFSNIFNMLPSHTTHIGISRLNSAWLISIIGLSDLISRICTGWFADYNVIPKRLIFQSSIFICGVTFCLAPMLKSYFALAVDCVIMSFTAGSFVALAPVLLTDAVGVANMSSAYGVMNFFGGFPFLLSPAIVSYLRDLTNTWDESFLLCGVLLFLSALANIVGARVCRPQTKTMIAGDSSDIDYSLDDMKPRLHPRANARHNHRHRNNSRALLTSIDANLLLEMHVSVPQLPVPSDPQVAQETTKSVQSLNFTLQ